jgi:hypothetical protein
MSIEFQSEETRGDYPATLNRARYSYDWREQEEVIIERSHQKMVEKASREKMMPRERFSRAMYGEGIDRIPQFDILPQNIMNQVLGGFSEQPPVIRNRDLLEYPNLQILSEVLWYARFECDSMPPTALTYGEEYLPKKFRLVEHGPR